MREVASYSTPAAVAKRLGVDVHKILTWIRRGELRAVDVSTTTGGRPRYRISEADLAVFLAARAAGPEPRISRIRRRKDPSVIEYF